MVEDRIEPLEERIRILREKVDRENLVVPDDVIAYIAGKYYNSHSLKGALLQIDGIARLKSRPVTLDFARTIIGTPDEVAAGQAGIAAAAAAALEPPVAEVASAGAEPILISAGLEAELPPAALFAAEPDPDLSPAVEPMSQPDDSTSAAMAPVSHTEPRPRPESAPAEVSASQPDLLTAFLAQTGAVPLDEPLPEEPTWDEPVAAEEPAFLGGNVVVEPEPHAPDTAHVFEAAAQIEAEYTAEVARVAGTEPAPVAPVAHFKEPATVWFAPMRTAKKDSLVVRAGRLLDRAGLRGVIEEGDLVAVKLHFGEAGNTGFVQPIFLREVVAHVKAYGGKPFLTDSNTLYRGARANAVDHLTTALQNGFSYATVEAPVIIADGLDGKEGVDVDIPGGKHFDCVRIGAAAVHAQAMVVVTHVKGHEATGFGGALKNVGMGLGTRAAKQRMHSDLKPEVTDEKCTACARCVKSCPVEAIVMGPDRVAVIDYELCYGCGECVASCAYGAIGIQWKTEPDAIQEKIVEHVAGAVSGKAGKAIYLSFVTNVSPDCDCWAFSDAPVVANVGVLASTDPVAIDQAAYDLVTAAAGLPGSKGEGLSAGEDKFLAITGIDGTRAITYAEEFGLGTRSYELRTLE